MTNPRVLLQIQGLGEITVELDPVRAPKTVSHFLSLVDSGFYNGTVFHRICPSYMIAGGGDQATGMPKRLKRSVENEAKNGLKNTQYAIAMGRTLSRDSITSEFFINVKNNPELDHTDDSHAGYGMPVFGRVIRGFEVVDKIAKMERKAKLFQEDQPVQTIVLERATQLAP